MATVLDHGMKGFFSRNISGWGRVLRAVIGLALIFLGWLISGTYLWLCIALVIAGVFALYEAIRGWCLMRACGLRTRF